MVNLLRKRGQENSTHPSLVIPTYKFVIPSGLTARNLLWGVQQHATILPSASNHKDADESAHAEAEDRKLRKDP